jgi:hypothetical protein
MVDKNIGDISVAEEAERIHYQQPMLTRICHFQMDDEAILMTNFRITELCKILHLFGLPMGCLHGTVPMKATNYIVKNCLSIL